MGVYIINHHFFSLIKNYSSKILDYNIGMRIIRKHDLNEKEIPELLAILWKAEYFIFVTKHKWDQECILTERLIKKFNLLRSELIIIESILWSERITISSISNYMKMHGSNTSKIIKKLIAKDILIKLPDGTFNITSSFAKKWYSFLNHPSLIKAAKTSVKDLEDDIKQLKDSLADVQKRLKIIKAAEITCK